MLGITMKISDEEEAEMDKISSRAQKCAKKDEIQSAKGMSKARLRKSLCDDENDSELKYRRNGLKPNEELNDSWN